MKFAIHTRAGRVVSVTCEGHQWLFRFPEGSLGKEPTIAEAEYKGSEKPHDPELEKQARKQNGVRHRVEPKACRKGTGTGLSRGKPSSSAV